MVRWPTSNRLSRVSATVLERFKKTSGAKELEQDARDWVLVNWPWMPDAPYVITARASDSEQREWVGEADGIWSMRVTQPATPPHAA